MAHTAFCYRIGDYRIALEEGIRTELLTLNTVYPVPFAPAWCAGLAGVRGDLSPVVDMHVVLFGQPQPRSPYLLSVRHDSFAPVILGCDELPRQVEVPEEDDPRTGTRPAGLPGWIKSAWTQADNSLLLTADHLRLFRSVSKVR